MGEKQSRSKEMLLKVWRRRETAYDPKHISSVKHGGGRLMAQTCMNVSGTNPVIFTNDIIQDGNSSMNSEVN